MAAFPSCGGALGTSWARRAYGETLDYVSSSTSEYHWIAGNAMTYAGPIGHGPRANQFPRKVEYLDADVHSVMSLIAPRAVLTNGGTDNSSGNGDAWQDPRGMYLAGAVSGPVWEFLDGLVRSFRRARLSLPPRATFIQRPARTTPQPVEAFAILRRNRLAARLPSTFRLLKER